MYYYITGEVTSIQSNYIVIENNGIGYKVYVANPYTYKLNEKYTIYLYNHIREDEYSLYGFTNEEELSLYLKLLQVKGLGPKVALPFFATNSYSDIVNAIENENILYLKKFPKIGDKLAKQIVLDLKGKLNTEDELDSKENALLLDALITLGYKKNEINKIVSNIDSNLTIEEQIKEALKQL